LVLPGPLSPGFPWLPPVLALALPVLAPLLELAPLPEFPAPLPLAELPEPPCEPPDGAARATDGPSRNSPAAAAAAVVTRTARPGGRKADRSVNLAFGKVLRATVAACSLGCGRPHILHVTGHNNHHAAIRR
jgi:hypothetical protein